MKLETEKDPPSSSQRRREGGWMFKEQSQARGSVDIAEISKPLKVILRHTETSRAGQDFGIHKKGNEQKGLCKKYKQEEEEGNHPCPNDNPCILRKLQPHKCLCFYYLSHFHHLYFLSSPLYKVFATIVSKNFLSKEA